MKEIKALTVNLKTACEMIGIKRNTLYKLIKDGVFSCSPLIRRNKLIPVSQLEKFAADASFKKTK